VVVLTDIYAAGEQPVDGVDSRALCQSIRARGKLDPVLVPRVGDVLESLSSLLADGDLLLIMGAGSVEQVAQQLREQAA
jgi:UDP-N-acetylmuramate--alanine ligase